MNETQPTQDTAFRWLYDRLQTRTRRRATVGFFFGVLASLILVTWFVDSYWLAAPFVVLYMAGTLLLHASVRGITETSTRDLDERQVALRNAGYRYTYWAGVMIAFLGGLFVARVSDWDTAFELGLFVTVWALLSSLPTLFLAWTLPSEEPDEEE